MEGGNYLFCVLQKGLRSFTRAESFHASGGLPIIFILKNLHLAVCQLVTQHEYLPKRLKRLPTIVDFVLCKRSDEFQFPFRTKFFLQVAIPDFKFQTSDVVNGRLQRKSTEQRTPHGVEVEFLIHCHLFREKPGSSDQMVMCENQAFAFRFIIHHVTTSRSKGLLSSLKYQAALSSLQAFPIL
jgi:hypothetical protein